MSSQLEKALKISVCFSYTINIHILYKIYATLSNKFLEFILKTVWFRDLLFLKPCGFFCSLEQEFKQLPYN